MEEDSSLRLMRRRDCHGREHSPRGFPSRPSSREVVKGSPSEVAIEAPRHTGPEERHCGAEEMLTTEALACLALAMNGWEKEPGSSVVGKADWAAMATDC